MSFGGVSDSCEAELLGVCDEGLDDSLEVVHDDGLKVGCDEGLEVGLVN
jgi:hypothetical protein